MEQILFNAKTGDFAALFKTVSYQDTCIIGPRNYGKTTLLSKFLDAYSSHVPVVVLDSATEHGSKSLINQTKSRPLRYKWLSMESESDWKIEKITKDEVILVDLSKHLEDSHRENSKEKREIYRNMSNFTIEKICELDTELALLTDEIEFSKRTKDIISMPDRNFFLVSAVHSKNFLNDSLNVFEYKINLLKD